MLFQLTLTKSQIIKTTFVIIMILTRKMNDEDGVTPWVAHNKDRELLQQKSQIVCDNYNDTYQEDE